MVVGLDHAGRDEAARCVEHALPLAGFQILGDFDDPATRNPHIGPIAIGTATIDYGSALDQDIDLHFLSPHILVLLVALVRAGGTKNSAMQNTAGTTSCPMHNKIRSYA